MVASNSLPDADLIALLRSGDQAAYTFIYRRYFKLLYLHAFHRIGNEEIAKDLIQEIFTVLWLKREEIGQTNLSGYLYTSVRNRVIDLYSREQVAEKYYKSIGKYAERYHETADHLIRERDMSALIEKEIQALPPRMREIFELSRKDNLSHKEIAEQLHISEHTVATQMTRALKALRLKLGIFTFILLILSR